MVPVNSLNSLTTYSPVEVLKDVCQTFLQDLGGHRLIPLI